MNRPGAQGREGEGGGCWILSSFGPPTHLSVPLPIFISSPALVAEVAPIIASASPSALIEIFIHSFTHIFTPSLMLSWGPTWLSNPLPWYYQCLRLPQSSASWAPSPPDSQQMTLPPNPQREHRLSGCILQWSILCVNLVMVPRYLVKYQSRCCCESISGMINI